MRILIIIFNENNSIVHHNNNDKYYTFPVQRLSVFTTTTSIVFVHACPSWNKPINVTHALGSIVCMSVQAQTPLHCADFRNVPSAVRSFGLMSVNLLSIAL